MEERDKAIILKTQKVGEKNKRITFFGAENGIFFATARGVLGGGAKLKFLNLPFCLCEVELLEGKTCIVKTASLIESFSNISQNLEKLNMASFCAQAILAIVEKGVNIKEIFALFLQALFDINNIDDFEKIFATKFVFELLKECGFELNLKKCNNCGNEPKKTFVNFSTGEFACENCFEEFFTQVKKRTIDNLNLIDSGDLTNIKISDKEINECLAFLNNFFLCNFGKKLNIL